ncbi:hypothetical protein KSS87_001253 [Heliosperma pusillum]|nr:hypothetical protein KSS87_001253 [Heliosperma pusillum]
MCYSCGTHVLLLCYSYVNFFLLSRVIPLLFECFFIFLKKLARVILVSSLTFLDFLKSSLTFLDF